MVLISYSGRATLLQGVSMFHNPFDNIIPNVNTQMVNLEERHRHTQQVLIIQVRALAIAADCKREHYILVS